MITFFKRVYIVPPTEQTSTISILLKIESHMDITLSLKTTIIINFDLLLKWAGHKVLITEKR